MLTDFFPGSTGYGYSLKFGGDYVDPTERDEFGSVKSCFVAIDAIPVGHGVNQLEQSFLFRELNKAYSGFKPVDETYPKLSTGNWGCGRVSLFKAARYMDRPHLSSDFLPALPRRFWRR